MEGLGGDIVSILKYLAPGFLSAWIFYGLTPHPKPPQFERVVQALIFTLINQFVIFFLQELYGFLPSNSLSSWSEHYQTALSAVSAVCVGLIASYLANTDTLHGFLRWCYITEETSYPSEWFGTFSKNKLYVVLHLKDDRRIYGWPREWPSSPSEGYFTLMQASWLEGDEETRLLGVRAMLIDVKDVRWVEFMEPPEGAGYGKEVS